MRVRVRTHTVPAPLTLACTRGKEYSGYYLQIDEEHNIQFITVLGAIKKWGNRPPGPHYIPGLKSGGPHTGQVGFTRTWKIRISETDLHLLHGSLATFKVTPDPSLAP